MKAENSPEEERSLHSLAGILDDALVLHPGQPADYNLSALNKILSGLQKQAEEFFFLKNFVDAGDWCFQLIGKVSASLIEESAAIKAIDSCFELLLQIIHEPDVAFELKNKIFQQAKEALEHSIDQNDRLEEKWMEVLKAVSEETNEEEKFRWLLLENKEVEVYREALIRQSFEERKFDRVKKLILLHSKHDFKSSFKINLKDKEWLLKVALAEKDWPSVCKLSEYLFRKKDYEMKHFFMLKKYSSPALWEKKVQQLLNFIKRDQRFYEDKVRAQVAILLEEKEDAQLLKLFELNTYLHLLEEYDDLLSKKFPHELIFLYKEALERYAEQNLGLTSYREVVKVLKRMLKLPGGKPVVQALAIKFKVIYQQRRGMVKVLNRLVL